MEEGNHGTRRKRVAEGVPDEHFLDVEPKILLYLPHLSVDEDAKEGPALSELNPDGALYTLEASSATPCPRRLCKSSSPSYSMDYMMHSFAFMFDESYLGRRVHDVLRTLAMRRRPPPSR